MMRSLAPLRRRAAWPKAWAPSTGAAAVARPGVMNAGAILTYLWPARAAPTVVDDGGRARYAPQPRKDVWPEIDGTLARMSSWSVWGELFALVHRAICALASSRYTWEHAYNAELFSADLEVMRSLFSAQSLMRIARSVFFGQWTPWFLHEPLCSIAVVDGCRIPNEVTFEERPAETTSGRTWSWCYAKYSAKLLVVAKVLEKTLIAEIQGGLRGELELNAGDIGLVLGLPLCWEAWQAGYIY